MTLGEPKRYKVTLSQHPDIGRGWWWTVEDYPDTRSAAGMEWRGFTLTQRGARREAGRMVKSLRKTDSAKPITWVE